jgi:hypothetical protein
MVTILFQIRKILQICKVEDHKQHFKDHHIKVIDQSFVVNQEVYYLFNFLPQA